MPKRPTRKAQPEEKLRAYDGKDYSEVIEFPVELVDRDGVVRQYSYEESLAVYHRRIQSAPWRYADDELIRAEIGHCTRRIDQIKRSYRSSSKSEGPSPSANPRAALGDGFEIVREHYEGLLRDRGQRLDELPLTVSLLQDEPTCRVYHVGVQPNGRGHLLYVHPFDRVGDQDPKAGYEQARAAYRAMTGYSQDVERLLLAREGRDAGYLLTGQLDLPDGLLELCQDEEGMQTLDAAPEAQPWWMSNPDLESVARPADDAFERGMEAMQADRNDEAIEALRLAVEQNPFHGEAYLALLAVLDGAGRFGEAEMYGEMAERHLPADAQLRHRRGINLVRQGALGDALKAFDEAAELDPNLAQPPFFAAQVAVVEGQRLELVRERLKRALAGADAGNAMRSAARQVDRLIWLRRAGSAAGFFGAAGFAALALQGHPELGGIGVVTALLFAASVPRLANLTARWLLTRPPAGTNEAED